MKLKSFLRKNPDGEYRVRPLRTAIACLLIAVLLVSISVGMSYSKFTFASDPFSTTYQLKDYKLPADRYVIQPYAPAASGSYSFVSPDTNVRVTYPKNSTDATYYNNNVEYLVAFFNPEVNTVDYTANSNQVQIRYEIGLGGINHNHPLDIFGLKSTVNNAAKGIVVYMKVGTDADPATINSSSLSVRYVNPENPSINTSAIATYGQIAISSFGQLFRTSTEGELLNSRFAVNYDKKGWSSYADTSWYDGDESDTTFYISTAAELAGLAKIVNDGTDTFEGKTVYLTNDISLADDSGYLRRWTSIGTYDHPFMGSFSGQYDVQTHTESGAIHTISGLNVADFGASGDTASAGLFGYVDSLVFTDQDDDKPQIRNLTIDTAYVSAELYDASNASSGAIGTVVGWLEYGVVKNVTVKDANVCGTAKCGGVIIGRIGAEVSDPADCQITGTSTVENGYFVSSGNIYGYKP